MKEKTDTRETARDRVMSDMADKALKNYEQIVRTGLKLQEEAGRCWTSFLSQTATLQDIQRPLNNFTAMANGILPEAQKRMEEVLDLVERNTRTGVELFRKATDAAQAPALGESQSRWMDVWTTSLGAARANTEALLQINSRALDSWLDFVEKSSEATQGRVAKSA